MQNPQIKREYLEATVGDQTISVMCLWYGETDITVAFASSMQLPIFPLGEKWAVLATAGKETLRVWSNEFVAGREMHNRDMAYPKIVSLQTPDLQVSSAVQPPEGLPQSLDRTSLAFFPSLVQEKVVEVADFYEYHLFTYYERQGTIEKSAPSLRAISLWLGGTEKRYWIYCSGAPCWVQPHHDTLFFDPIASELLPSVPDPKTYWIIYHGEDEPALKVYRISLVSADEVTTDWTDL